MRYISTSVVTLLAFAAFSTLAAPPNPLDSLTDPGKLPPASTQAGLTYEKDIHPIFDTACVRCHGEKRPRAGLRLDTLDGVLTGSKDHKDVVPGDSGKSRLAFAVADIDGKVYMPPKPPQRRPPAPNGDTNSAPPPPPPNPHPWKPLTTEQVGLIRAWIDQGAK